MADKRIKIARDGKVFFNGVHVGKCDVTHPRRENHSKRFAETVWYFTRLIKDGGEVRYGMYGEFTEYSRADLEKVLIARQKDLITEPSNC